MLQLILRLCAVVLAACAVALIAVSALNPPRQIINGDEPARVADNIAGVGAQGLCVEGQRLVTDRSDGFSVSHCEAVEGPAPAVEAAQ